MFCILFTMCTYPSQSVKISIHSCTFSKNLPILFIFLFQERFKRSQQFGFIYHTACAPQYFSVSEKHQRRHGLDAVLACCYAVLVHIHLDDSDAVAQYTLYLLQNGVHRLARLAPCSKEIDQNKLATVYYVIECLHNYLSISVKRLKVLPSLVTFPKNIFPVLPNRSLECLGIF